MPISERQDFASYSQTAHEARARPESCMALFGSFGLHHADKEALLERPTSEPLLRRKPKMFKRSSGVGDFEEERCSSGVSIHLPIAAGPPCESILSSAPEHSRHRLRSCLRHCDSPPSSAPELSRHVSWDSHISVVAVTPNNNNKRTPPRPAVFSGLHWEIEGKLDFGEVVDSHSEVDLLQAALAEAIVPCSQWGGDVLPKQSAEEDQICEDVDEANLENDISPSLIDDGYRGWSLKRSSNLAAPCDELGATWQSPARQKFFPTIAV